MKIFNKLLVGATALTVSVSASAGWVVHNPIGVNEVPVDSPWALAGLGALLAVAVARFIRRR